MFQANKNCIYIIKYLCDSVCVCSVGSGAVGAGSLCREPDVTLSMSDRDLLAMFHGELRPYAAYTSGRLKIQGDITTAMKLEELIDLLKNQRS